MDFRYGGNHYDNVFDDQYDYVPFSNHSRAPPPPFVPLTAPGGPPPPYIPPATDANGGSAAFGPPSSFNDMHDPHARATRHDHRYATQQYSANSSGGRSKLRNARLTLNNVPPLQDILTTLQTMPIAQSQYQFPVIALVARMLIGAHRRTFLGILQRIEGASSKAMAFNEILQLTRNLANEFPQEFVPICEIEYKPDRNGFIASTQVGPLVLQGRAASKRSARENVCSQLIDAMEQIAEAVESVIGAQPGDGYKARRSEEVSPSVLEAAKAARFPTIANPYEPPKKPVCITINNKDDQNDTAVSPSAASGPALPPAMPRSQQLSAKNRIGGIDVAVLITNKFDRLLTTVPLKYRPYQVLAGIALTNPLGQAQVISIGTGTKVIRGEHLSLDGTALKDMHAEILSIRGLKRFLLQQLFVWMNPPTRTNSIFEKPNNNNTSGLLRLKSGYAFHLYINTAPCGDGRVYCLSRGGGVRNLGALRSKIENGEGTVLIPEEESEQAYDGVIGGRRLRIMCCSDKLLRRNFLGLQGALLACAVEPVYLSSLWVGKLYDLDHLQRAVSSRLKYSAAFPSFPSGFKVNRPQLIYSSLDDGASVKKKSMAYSITYTNLNYADMLFDDDQHPMRPREDFTKVAAELSSSLPSNDVRSKALECIGQILRAQRDCVEIIDSLTGKMVADCNDNLTNRDLGILGVIEKRRGGSSSILCKSQLLQEYLKVAVLRAALLDTYQLPQLVSSPSAPAGITNGTPVVPAVTPQTPQDTALHSLPVMTIKQLLKDGTPPNMTNLLENISFLPAALSESACLSYRLVKVKSSATYTNAKSRLDRMLTESRLGHWVRKSQDEEDHIILGNAAGSHGALHTGGDVAALPTRAYDVDETSEHADNPEDADMLTIPEATEQIMEDASASTTPAETTVVAAASGDNKHETDNDESLNNNADDVTDNDMADDELLDPEEADAKPDYVVGGAETVESERN